MTKGINKAMNRLIVLCICITCLNSLFAQTIRICPDCSNNNISQTIEKAMPGDTLLIETGVYTEHDILVDKPLTILGIDRPLIDASLSGYGLIIKSDSVSVKGIDLTNIGKSYTQDYAGIYLSRSNHFILEDNILDKVSFGILVEKSHHGIIRNNTVSSDAKDEASAGNGIHLWHSSHVIIEGNKLFQLRDGIYFEFVTDSKVLRNISYDNLRYGLHFMFSNNDEYHYNTFTNNGAGVAVMFSKFIEMTYNQFDKNWGTASYGILLKEIYDAEIHNNIIRENTIGVHVEGSTRVNYTNNRFEGNGWAVKVRGACYENVFTGNSFLNNSFDVSYNSKLNDNRFDQNYWSSYTGYDLDKDGIGDVPFRPVKLFSYVVNETPESIILLRSLFIDIIDFSERVSPVFTPDNLMDERPLMKDLEP